MAERKKKIPNKSGNFYSKHDSFENLKTVQRLALNRKGKDDELNPDISVYLKAEELKGKLCGLYTEKDVKTANINIMGSVKIDGAPLQLNVGDEAKTEIDND